MKNIFMLLVLSFSSAGFAQSKVKIEIKELTNLAKSTALEVCGIASHDDGVKPLLVTINHDQSTYTTIASEDGKWCVVFKRWTNDGKITAQASTLDFKEKSAVTTK